jgi:hypothetical protein
LSKDGSKDEPPRVGFGGKHRLVTLDDMDAVENANIEDVESFVAIQIDLKSDTSGLDLDDPELGPYFASPSNATTYNHIRAAPETRL